MSYRWGIVTLCTAAAMMQGPAVRADGFRDLFHRGEGGGNQGPIDSCVKQRAVMAYFQSPKGGIAPVRDTMNAEHDQDWLGLRFTDYDGPRIRLGVLKVLNKAPEAEDQNGGKIEVPVAGIQEILTVALYNTKRFDVIEQKRIAEIEKQQTRKDVFEPSPTSIVNAGKALGAQYLIYGTVNEWDPNRGGISGKHQGGGPFSALSSLKIGYSKKESEVAIVFSLVDVANGQILYTTLQRARLGEGSFALGLTGDSGTTVEKTPVGYAVSACANKAAFEIARFLRNRKWKGSVVEVAKADVFINAGSQQGMVPQTKLIVQEVRRIIRDRESGTILGEDLRGIGTLEVIAVQTAFSVARVVEGCDGIKPGDRVELATPPVPVPTPPECAALDVSQTR